MLLFALVGLVFGRTVTHDFINFDDDDYVYENPDVSRGLSAAGIRWAFAQRHAANWHPLTWLSHMLDATLYGLDAGGHHATSVLLHASAAALLFLALRLMTGSLRAGAFAAALFAVHPLHVESVAWVAERKDVLSGLFFTLTLLAYLGYARKPSSHARYLTVIALFAAGLMSKPMLVTLPLLLLLLDFWPLGRAKGGAAALMPLLREKIPLLALSAASSAVTLLAQREALIPAERLPFAWRLGNALVAGATYVGKSIVPVNLAIFYPHPGPGLQPWQMAAAAIGLLGVTWVAVAARRRQPHLLVGWLWFAGMLVPVIGIVQVGEQAMADRYAYLPQIGLCLAVACTAAAGRTRSLRRGIFGAAVASVALLAGMAWRQAGYWRDSETLFTRALAVTSGNYVAHNNLGILRAKAGRNDEAAAHFRQALAIKPLYPDALANLGMSLAAAGSTEEAIAEYRKVLAVNPDHPEARTNLGVALAQRGAADEAMAEYRRVLAADPDHLGARTNLGVALAQRGARGEAIAEFRKVLALDPDHPGALTNLGVALAAGGFGDEAILSYRKALAADPQSADARYNLGVALAQRGAHDEAIAEYRKVLATNPGHADAHYNLGDALVRRGAIDEAIAHYREAAAIRPDSLAALVNLGAALVTRGAIDEAIALYRKALGIDPDYTFAHVNLGVALARRGRADEAIAHYRRAVELKPDSVEAHFNLGGLLAARGRHEEAAAHRRRALDLAARQGDPALLESLRRAVAAGEAAAR